MNDGEGSKEDASDEAWVTFQTYLMAHGGRLDGDFDAYCGAHTDVAEELRELGRRWSVTPPSVLPYPDVDGYEVVGEIGRGGMGVVYEAKQQRPRRRVALKVIRGDVLDDERRRRLEREGEALARLRHRGIVPLYATGYTADGSPWLAMERVDGVRLDRFVAERELGVEERLRLFRRIGAAVVHAHRSGVVHRDLKPSNILVTMEDDKPEVRVLDFGLAQFTGSEVTLASTLLEPGRILGTLAYMSPEQARGDAAGVDGRSDVYSLGVLLYELVSGRRPIDVDDCWIGHAVERVVHHVPPPLSALDRSLRGDLDTITSRALQKDPVLRYATVEDLVEDVERFLEGRPIRARKPSLLYRMQRLVARHRTVAAVISVGVLVSLIGVSIAAGLLASKNRELSANQRSILQLADLWRVEQYRDEAETLWPGATLSDLEGFVARGKELVERLPLHRKTLSELEKPSSEVGAAEREWWRATLAALVRETEDLGVASSGLIPRLERALLFARVVRERTIEGPEARRRWDAARRDAMDPEQTPRYHGFDLTPQLGLLPIGRDPNSGLLEFWHVESGEEPRRDDDGHLIVTENSGVVLVLLPGGTFWMGAQSDDPNARNYDPHASTAREGPPTEVSLSPFFLSKYEVTQGQWLRIWGANPSRIAPGGSFGSIDLRHPVERVTMVQATQYGHRLGLELPTEAQWEYGARAGVTTRFPHGDSVAGLDLYANVADRFALENGGSPDDRFSIELNDGQTYHAPVGSYRANAFGLYDVIGNVYEWCRDGLMTYDKPMRTGDGARTESAGQVVLRGGSYMVGAVKCRLSARGGAPSTVSHDNIGFRPSRTLTNFAE